MGLNLRCTHNASTPVELDAAFSAIAAQHPDALLVGSDPFLLIRRNDLVAFAARYKIPTIYPFREFADAGGLIRDEHCKRLPPGGHLCRSHSQGGKACGAPGCAADKI
jgi:hypothetical protein